MARFPGVKSVKTDQFARQSESFMGNTFSYEDQGPVKEEKFTHRLLRQRHTEISNALFRYVFRFIPTLANPARWYGSIEKNFDQCWYRTSTAGINTYRL